MPLKKVNISQEARRLTNPFSMIELAYVDDFVVDVYICQGAIAWHRHVDQDELFLVYSGVITLDSEWGNVLLQPHEFAIVPKGVGHRSSSFVWSVVLLFQPKFVPDRKNGDRRLFVPKGEKRLQKFNLDKEAARLILPFSTIDLAYIEDFVVRLVVCQGSFQWHRHTNQDELLLVQKGEVFLESEEGDVTLQEGELVVVPKKMMHKHTSVERAEILFFERQSVALTGD